MSQNRECLTKFPTDSIGCYQNCPSSISLMRHIGKFVFFSQLLKRGTTFVTYVCFFDRPCLSKLESCFLRKNELSKTETIYGQGISKQIIGILNSPVEMIY